MIREPEVQAPPAAQRREAPRPSTARDRPLPLSTLKKRSEFLACARARRAHAPAILVQGRQRGPGEAEGIRVGVTASKKIGKAVVRNRAKRRLREAARAILPWRGREGWDYVLVARPDVTVSRPFAELTGDLEQALSKLHGRPRR